MTTPERLRRRQRIETGLVAAAIVLSAGSVYMLDRQNAEQDRCIARQVTELTTALNSRSAQAARLNDATGDVIDSFVEVAARPEAERDNEPILKALEHYAQVRDDVNVDRKRNPFPPFPTGQCD